MHWKSWSYSVKGASIGCAVALLYIWWEFTHLFRVYCSLGTDCPTAWESFVSGGYVLAILLTIMMTVLGSGIGYLIGYLYGKVKNRRKAHV